MRRGYYDAPILPCGRVNVTTGKFTYGNFYGFWGDNTTYEVYRTEKEKIRVVATSGTEPTDIKVGERKGFRHDQTFAYLFEGRYLESVVGDDGFRSLKEKYGNSITVATYK